MITYGKYLAYIFFVLKLKRAYILFLTMVGSWLWMAPLSEPLGEILSKYFISYPYVLVFVEKADRRKTLN